MKKTEKTKRQSRITRRGFIGAAGAATVFTIVPRHVVAGAGKTPPSEKLNIACIGVGGMGFNTIRSVMSENIAFLCDVDEKRASNAYEMFPKAKRYSDYRRMLDKEHKNIDAVAVTTPNHVHIPACVMAMKMGKHVFSEKPLGHNIEEIRIATELAKSSGLATQMGSAGHGGRNYPRVVELIQAGAIGEVREVHVWCDNEWEKTPRKRPQRDKPRGTRGRPTETPPVPKNLKWDLWLGPAPVRPYHPAYHPRSWRSWWDFGSGRLGDMGCHFLDLPFWALDLKAPLTVKAEGPAVSLETTPSWTICKWTFGARGEMPPVEVTWYDGNMRPDLPEEVNPPDWEWGLTFVGSKGMLLANHARHELHPKEKFADFKRPPQTITPGGYQRSWIAACKSDDPAKRNFEDNPVLCSFDYAGPLTELVLLGTLAFRVGQELEWDSANLRTTNSPEANLLIGRENRKGWEL